MNPTVKHLLGVTAAAAIGVPALLVTGAAPAVAAQGAHCDRAQQDMWSNGPSRNLTAHRCSVPSHKKRWYTVEIDTLVQTHYKGDTLDGGVDRTRTLRNRIVRCLGYTSDTDEGTINWFGCPPL
ncbi:hypothetical protein ACF061_10435 [Streptomyces sp. NPDC015220]|uniref:hypothetical protein n=1 Tax=Streptomyces sp. NPDC015220 TaxID=3364947 RepID=UPI0036FDC89F